MVKWTDDYWAAKRVINHDDQYVKCNVSTGRLRCKRHGLQGNQVATEERMVQINEDNDVEAGPNVSRHRPVQHQDREIVRAEKKNKQVTVSL